MLLTKLQSGFLFYETQQGLVRVELTFQQRLSLLWTFRHFSQLSVVLLNQRERVLVNDLFRNNPGILSEWCDSMPVIGTIENFVPAAALDAALAQKPFQKREREERAVAQLVAQSNAVPLYSRLFAWSNSAISNLAGSAQDLSKLAAARLSNSRFALPRLAMPTLTMPKLAMPTLTMPRLTIPSFAMPKLTMPRLAMPRLAMPRLIAMPSFAMPRISLPKLPASKLATTVGVLSLGVVSLAAWHRVQASQALNQPQLQQMSAATLPISPDSTKSAAIVEGASPAVAAAQIPTDVSLHGRGRKRAMRVHDAVSTPKFALSGHDSRIQASRAPVHFVYPSSPDVHTHGTVSLTAILDSSGKVRAVKVVSGSRALAAAAVRAVRQWRYRPYLKDGKPVATETNIVFSFFAGDATSMSFPPRMAATAGPDRSNTVQAEAGLAPSQPAEGPSQAPSPRDFRLAGDR